MNRSLAPLLLAALSIPLAAHAHDDADEPTVITLRPADEPTPALKYRLLPEARELVPGNAAIFYHRAILMVQSVRYRETLRNQPEGLETTKSPETAISDWISGPLDQIPREEAHAQINSYKNALREVELGALRRDCDWEFDNRPETFTLMFPEIQDSRSLARLISLKVRLAVLDGETDLALHWLQVGDALGRHVSQGPTIIQALVGVAIVSVLNGDLLELIQAEGTPSLYWAIAARPEPFIDMSVGLEGERMLLERMLPDFEDLDGPPWSVERGRQFIDEVIEQLSEFSGGPSVDRWNSHAGMAVLVAKVYPEARRSLIDQGRPEAEVDAMPTVQVVGIDSYRQYRTMSDDLYKWMSLPYRTSYQHLDEAFRDLTPEDKLANPGIALFTLLQPGLNAIRLAELQLDRQFAAIQCVEAIRMDANAHDGRLPTSLEAITEAPTPTDPATGMPFDYAVDGQTATLKAPLIPGGPDHPAYRINYELRLAD